MARAGNEGSVVSGMSAVHGRERMEEAGQSRDLETLGGQVQRQVGGSETSVYHPQCHTSSPPSHRQASNLHTLPNWGGGGVGVGGGTHPFRKEEKSHPSLK